MVTRRLMLALAVAGGALFGGSGTCMAQCCLDGLFAGCASCFRKAPPAYAVAPVMAPVVAPIPAPPPPVMVPVQQVSYVPETTYQTKYECVPVTSYKPSCEVDPCTGCTRECMEQVVNYQQRPVSVPVTQYRAVYSTKYVQMQPGVGAPAAYPAPAAAPAFTTPAPAPAAASPFAAPVQTAPQGWGAAGADVPQQLIPGQPAYAPGQPTYAAPALPPMTAPQPAFQQQIVPQSGAFAAPAPTQAQLQPTAPPALSPAPVSPAPSLKPIPEMPKTAPQTQNGAKAATGNGATGTGSNAIGTGTGAGATSGQASPPQSSPSLAPIHPSAAPGAGSATGAIGMPVMPGPGPSPATNAFPKLLEPTGHTTQYQPMVRPMAAPATQWQPAVPPPTAWQPTVSAGQAGAYASPQRPGGYPTAALPIRSQQ